MDDVYLLNNPFTFQAMEKHSAYCAMMRLGLKVPETWLIPHKQPPANERFRRPPSATTCRSTSRRSPAQIGYPLYMKPFDGGQWVGVTRIRDATELHAVYDESGERLMHLQAAVEDFDVFARSLSIGAETMVMRFEPDRPMHDRYQVDHDFLSAETGDEVVTISRLVNAFFRWEFNSCETIVKDGVASPIDYANASPDVALTSLHYYFPWAMRALVRWTAFCCATGRRCGSTRRRATTSRSATATTSPTRRSSPGTGKLADDYFQVDEYEEFCATNLPHLDEALRRVRRGARLRPRCSSTRCSRPSRRTSTSSSSPTTAACSRRGRTTSADRVGLTALRACRAASSNGVSSNGMSARIRSSRAIVGLRRPSTSGRATDALTGVTRFEPERREVGRQHGHLDDQRPLAAAGARSARSSAGRSSPPARRRRSPRRAPPRCRRRPRGSGRCRRARSAGSAWRPSSA